MSNVSSNVECEFHVECAFQCRMWVRMSNVSSNVECKF